MHRSPKWTRRVFTVVVLVAGLILPCGPVLAEIEIDLFLSPAPNPQASPSYEEWFQNAQAFSLGAAAPVGSGCEVWRQ